MHWKNGLAQGFALFSHGAAAQAAINQIHNLVFDDGAVCLLPKLDLLPIFFSTRSTQSDIPLIAHWPVICHMTSCAATRHAATRLGWSIVTALDCCEGAAL